MKIKIWRGMTIILASFWSVFLFFNAYIYKTKLYESKFAMIYAIAGIFAMLFYLWQITVLVMPKKSFDSWNEWIHSLFLRNLFETASWLMLSISLLLYFMTEENFLSGALLLFCLSLVWGCGACLTWLMLKNDSRHEQKERSFEAVSSRLMENVHYVVDSTVEKFIENEIIGRFNACLRRSILALVLTTIVLISSVCDFAWNNLVFAGAGAFFALYFAAGKISYRSKVVKQRKQAVYLLAASQLLGIYKTIISLADTRILDFRPIDELQIAYCLFRVETFEECMAYMDTISSEKYSTELEYLRLSCNVGLHRRDRALAIFADLQEKIARMNQKKAHDYRLGLTFLSTILWRRYDQAQVELNAYKPCITEEEETFYQAWIDEKAI